VPQNVVKGSAKNGGINKNFEIARKGSNIAVFYFSSGWVMSVCYQLPLCFASVSLYLRLCFVLSVFVSYCYRAASPVLTKSLPAINFLWPVKVGVGES
jgi:hypothetical protein